MSRRIDHFTHHSQTNAHNAQHTSLLQDIKTNTGNIKIEAETIDINIADLEVLQTAANGKLDTINTTLSSGIGGLPTSLTGSGNLKVSLQELGNEGSERLNVDVGTTVSQLPTALTGEGNLKVSIQEDFTHNLATSAKQDDINNTLSITLGVPLSAIAGFTNTANGKLDTINSSIGNVATESTLQIIAEEFTKCDTDNVVITGGVVLPSALTGSGNLKVCIQELGNEGSERLNVDVGNAVAQLPTALSGSGRLKIENDFDGAVTNGALTALASAINSDKVDVNISSGGFGGAVTNAGLTALNNSIGSNKVNVNISSGGFDGAVTNAGLTALNSAVNSDKVDVNISSGNISGFATSSLQGTTNTKLDTIDGVIDNLLVKQTLATTAEDKEVIDDDAISPETLSIAIDTENYERVRFYGNTSTSAAVLGGSDLLVYGSESSTGTYYNIPGTSFSAQTLTISGGSAVHHIGLELQNTPRFIKIFNKSNSSTYTIVKLRMVGSGGRLVI